MKSPVPPAAALRSPAARPRRRPVRWALVGVAVLAVAAGSGCRVDNTPTNYDAQDGIVGKNYVEGCTGRAQTEQSTTTVLAPESVCTCQFQVFKANVPYNGDDRARVTSYPSDKPTFQELDQSVRNDPTKINDLPEDVRKKLDACKAQGQAGPVVASTTSTTAAASVTTTTAAATTTTAP